MDWHDIESGVVALCKLYVEQLPAGLADDLIDFAIHGEWGIALEGLASNLYEYDIPVSRTTYDEIVRLGTLMQLNEEWWASLQPVD